MPPPDKYAVAMVPQLPSLSSKQLQQQMRGCTNESNVVVPGMLICGAQPDLSSGRTSGGTPPDPDGNLQALLRHGVTVFVSLQAEARGAPYRAAAERLAAELAPQVGPRELEFRQLPTKDGGTFEDEALHAFVEQLLADLRAGKKMYVHCRGGHGRTGVVVACLLGYLYPSLTASQVLERIQRYHDARVNPMGELVMVPRSPQTPQQHAQARRMLERRPFSLLRLANGCWSGLEPSWA